MANLVYHYTSIEALEGIIRDDICLWATRYDHLNDPHEQIWAKNVILDKYLKKPQYKMYSASFVQNWFAKQSYILSLCEIPDYRNMWRLYCNDGKGVCLTLDENLFEISSHENSVKDPQHSYDIYESVLYSSKKKIESAVEYWQKQKIFNRNPQEPIDELMNLCAFIKDDDFDIENEKRYARIREIFNIKCKYNPIAENKADFEFHMDDKEVKCRLREGTEFVPYMELHFSPKILKAITIGYKYPYDETKLFISNIFSKHGDLYKHVNIEKSSL